MIRLKVLVTLFIAAVVLLILGPSTANANPIHKSIKVQDDGTRIEIGLEFEMNLEIKVNGERSTDTTVEPPSSISTESTAPTSTQTTTAKVKP